MSAAADTTLLDFSALPALAQVQAQNYQSAKPFPHAVFDNFISLDLARAIAADVPAPGAEKNWRAIVDNYSDGDAAQHGKLGLPHEAEFSPLIRALLWELNSGPFLRFLETLTGIKGLIADPRLQGGGVHQILPGGYLGVHADFTEHKYYGLSRRLNVLIYLNENWQNEWGGHLELWERDLSRCARRVQPTLGRCVIFSTDDTSYHGHPEPLACPEGVTRKSLALYYYTNGRQDAVDSVTHTEWHKTHRTELPIVE